MSSSASPPGRSGLGRFRLGRSTDPPSDAAAARRPFPSRPASARPASTRPASTRPGPTPPASSRPGPTPPATGRTAALRRRFDVDTWSGALAVMVAVVALLWVVEIVDAAGGHRLDRFGLRPRRLDGLDGILTMPFLHGGGGHLLANTFPLLVIGWMVLVSGLGLFLRATAIIIVAGGIGTWLVGSTGTVIVGASAVIFGWLGYLLARAYFARKVGSILAAAFALFFFGGLFSGLLPTVRADISWQAHVCGFLAGVLAGYLLHPAKGSPRALKRSGTGGPDPMSTQRTRR